MDDSAGGPATQTRGLGEADLSTREVAELLTWGDAVVGFEHASGTLFAEVEARMGLSRSSFELLQRLLRAPEQRAPITQLARTLIFSSGGMTKLADRLVEAGLVERVPSPDDRRVINLALTDAGLTSARAAARIFIDALRRTVVSQLGEDQYQQLVALLSGFSGADAGCAQSGSGP